MQRHNLEGYYSLDVLLLQSSLTLRSASQAVPSINLAGLESMPGIKTTRGSNLHRRLPKSC